MRIGTSRQLISECPDFSFVNHKSDGWVNPRRNGSKVSFHVTPSKGEFLKKSNVHHISKL